MHLLIENIYIIKNKLKELEVKKKREKTVTMVIP